MPEVSLLFSYRSRTYLKPLTVSGMQSVGGKLPYPAQEANQDEQRQPERFASPGTFISGSWLS